MSTQPTAGMQGTLTGAAMAEGVEPSHDDANTTIDDGATVGQADREADVERSGAGGDDDRVAPSDTVLSSDALGTGNASDGDVPVGAADAEADRRRTTDDDGA